ncbi:AraC family transcriptional regulator [Chryseobacterium sp.]|uniref:helix-turn-helix domain-containing protein n=1 Tax=Chryseobacterium sp. TaxID=1871047 RepID=UPI0025C0BB0A|nr:AraC family transcriptional regulator [Chryseobacterium sp.]MBV8327376.1 helix-turn-helix transcriptional regulator [Chryseobacterium sp.]
MQFEPPGHLKPFIRHYIFLENSEKNTKDVRLFTDGSTGLILSGDMKLYSRISDTRMPLSFFYGALSSYKDFYSQGEFFLIAVIFQPYFLNILLKASARESRDQIISVEDVFQYQLLPFQESLFNKISPISVINELNIFFSDFLHKKTDSDYKLIIAVQQYILTNNGRISSKELEKFSGYSERQLERKFENNMGLSPKKYSNIIRLHYFLSLINKAAGDQNMTGLSYHAGYADQSHLIREFKNNVGLTPKQYLKTENKMAVNFIEL